MQRLSIGAINEYEEIENRFLKEKEQYDLSSCYISKKEKIGNSFFLHFNIEEASRKTRQIKEILARSVVDVIIHLAKFHYISKYIERRYDYLSTMDKDVVCTRITKFFTEHSIEEQDEILGKQYRKIMEKRFLQLIQEKSSIQVEGFMIFRLKEYTARLKEIVDQTIDHYMVEREYEEFIDLMIGFVEEQPSAMEVMHVIPVGIDTYRFIDGDNVDVTNRCIQEFEEDMGVQQYTQDDLLLTTLLLNAPKQIIIHGDLSSYNEDMLMTIEKVFENRISYNEEINFKSPLDICER